MAASGPRRRRSTTCCRMPAARCAADCSTSTTATGRSARICSRPGDGLSRPEGIGPKADGDDPARMRLGRGDARAARSLGRRLRRHRRVRLPDAARLPRRARPFRASPSASCSTARSTPRRCATASSSSARARPASGLFPDAVQLWRRCPTSPAARLHAHCRAGAAAPRAGRVHAGAHPAREAVEMLLRLALCCLLRPACLDSRTRAASLAALIAGGSRPRDRLVRPPRRRRLVSDPAAAAFGLPSPPPASAGARAARGARARGDDGDRSRRHVAPEVARELWRAATR